ncbi:MAG TPA: aromatic ring-hydroxylating dioxygenase subunit alpha [Pseudonocardia sp.]|nr:aromatic ring-hydroxylating dioxygenase subunit alpha [Pseudonocardia sp.]
MTIPSDARDTMISVESILKADSGPEIPAGVLEQSPPKSFGTEDIAVDRYLSEDFMKLEYEKLWSRVWQWACLDYEIPEPGDHLVYEIGDKSVLIVRQPEGDIKAFYNSCQHRATLMAEGPGKGATSFVCPFHAWAYNLDGTLKNVPCQWDFPQVTENREKFGLREIKCDVYGGFVFINFDDNASPLLDHLDVIPEHFKPFPLENRFSVANIRKIVPINWKACMEAFMESYHVVQTHQQALEFTGDANTQYDIWNTTSRLITLTGTPSPHLPEGHSEEDVFAAAAEAFAPPGTPIPPLPEGVTAREAIAELAKQMVGPAVGLDLNDRSHVELIDSIEYFVFPNWLPWAGVTQGLQYRFRPNGNDPHSSIFDIQLQLPFNPEGPRPPSAPLKVLEYEDSFAEKAPELSLFGPIFDQDFSNLVLIQKGMKTHGKPGVSFSDYQEARIRHFHQLLDKWLEL